jgi:hypothetical protein
MDLFLRLLSTFGAAAVTLLLLLYANQERMKVNKYPAIEIKGMAFWMAGAAVMTFVFFTENLFTVLVMVFLAACMVMLCGIFESWPKRKTIIKVTLLLVVLLVLGVFFMDQFYQTSEAKMVETNITIKEGIQETEAISVAGYATVNDAPPGDPYLIIYRKCYVKEAKMDERWQEILFGGQERKGCHGTRYVELHVPRATV